MRSFLRTMRCGPGHTISPGSREKRPGGGYAFSPALLFFRTLLIAFAAIFLATGGNAADWVFVRGTNTNTGSGTTNTLTITAVTSGDVVVGGVLLSTGSRVTKVTDSQNNCYRVTTDSDDGSSLYTAAYRSCGLITNAPTSITVTVAPTSATFWIAADEFTPPTGTTAISLDGSQIMVNQALTTTPNFQTLNSDDLVYAISFSSGTSTTGAGFTAATGSGTAIASEWKIQAAASTTVNAVYATQTAQTWMPVVAISPVAQTRWEFRQRANQHATTNATTGSVSFPNAVPAGDIVVCTEAVDSGVTVNSLVDDKSNNYLPNTLSPNSNGRRVFWSGGLLNNGPTTITITVSASSTTVFFLCADFQPPPGTASVAVSGGGLVNTTTDTGATTTTPNITTTTNNNLAYGMCEPAAGGGNPGANSFSGLTLGPSTWVDGYFIKGAAGTVNFSCTHADPTAINQSLVTFSATAGSAGVTRLPLMGVGG